MIKHAFKQHCISCTYVGYYTSGDIRFEGILVIFVVILTYYNLYSLPPEIGRWTVYRAAVIKLPAALDSGCALSLSYRSTRSIVIQ